MTSKLCLVRNDELGLAFIADLRKVFNKSGWGIQRYERARRRALHGDYTRSALYLNKGRGEKVGLTYEMALGMFVAIKRSYLMNGVNPFVEKN